MSRQACFTRRRGVRGENLTVISDHPGLFNRTRNPCGSAIHCAITFGNRPMNRAPTIKSGLPQEHRILRSGTGFLWELVLWERNSLRDNFSQSPDESGSHRSPHRPMNRAPTPMDYPESFTFCRSRSRLCGNDTFFRL